jgi:hypothetical protein
MIRFLAPQIAGVRLHLEQRMPWGGLLMTTLLVPCEPTLALHDGTPLVLCAPTLAPHDGTPLVLHEPTIALHGGDAVGVARADARAA